jgi:hypothetical protein
MSLNGLDCAGIVTRQDRVHVLHAYTKRLSMTARREHERNRTPAIAKPVTDHTAASFQEIMQATDDEIEELHKSIEILGRPTRRVAQYERLRRRRRAAGVGGPDVPLVLRNGQFILATEATPAPTGPVALPELAPPAAATGVSWGSAIVAPSTHDDNGIDLSVTDHGRQTTRQKATGLLINGLRSGELEDVLAQTDAGTDEDPPSWLKPVQPETETEPELETEPEPELSATRGSDAGSSTGAAQQAGSERAEEGDTAKPQAEAEKAQEDVATWVVGWIKAQLFQNPISKIASDQPPQTHSAASRAIQEDNSVPPPGPLQPVSEVEATQLAPQVQPSTAASTTGHLVVSTASEGAANSPAIVPPSRSGSAESQAQAQAPSPAPTPVTRAAKSLSEQLEDLLAGQTSRAKNAESQEDRAVREATAQVAAAEQAQADTAELARIESVRVEAETWVDIMRAKRAAKKLQKKKEDKSKEELEAAEAEKAVRRAAAAERQHAHAALARQRDDLRSSRE